MIDWVGLVGPVGPVHLVSLFGLVCLGVQSLANSGYFLAILCDPKVF